MVQHVEVIRRGFGSRSRGSLGGALFGFVLVAVGLVLLFMNEGRSVKRDKDLREGLEAVVAVSSDEVDHAREGSLVHTVGHADPGPPLADPEFGISIEAVRLVRSVEMFQWVENVSSTSRNRAGGSSEETRSYSYERRWMDRRIDSDGFKVAEGHRNPPSMKYAPATTVAETVALGAFTLSPSLVAKIGGRQPLPVESLDGASEEVAASARIVDGAVYIGESPADPAVGDLRVRFSHVPPGTVSVVAGQSGATFAPYRTRTGGTVELLEAGDVDAAEMFRRAQDRNRFLTWALRAGGFLLLAIAFSMILRPIAVLASIIPFLGRLVGMGTSFLAFLLAGILWTVTVGFSWVFHRPLLGGAILLATVLLSVVFLRSLAKRPAAPPSLPGSAPAP